MGWWGDEVGMEGGEEGVGKGGEWEGGQGNRVRCERDGGGEVGVL